MDPLPAMCYGLNARRNRRNGMEFKIEDYGFSSELGGYSRLELITGSC